MTATLSFTLLLASSLLGTKSDTMLQPSPIPSDRVFPLLVPTGYFEQPDEEGARTVVHPLIPGLQVALVVEELESSDHGAGLIRNVREIDLRAAKMDAREAWKQALENLMVAVEQGKIRAAAFEGDANKGKLILWGGHWLAATAILLPGLAEMASKTLNSAHLVAAIPHRDALVIFSDENEASRKKTAAFVREQEKDGRKPITDRLLRLLPNVRKPFYEQSPIEWREP